METVAVVIVGVAVLGYFVVELGRAVKEYLEDDRPS